MEMTQILPELRKLKRVEKLFIMQFLVSELAQEESELEQILLPALGLNLLMRYILLQPKKPR